MVHAEGRGNDAVHYYELFLGDDGIDSNAS